MRLLYQTSLRSGTRNLGDGKIAAEAVLLSTDAEMAARLVVAADSLSIEHAEWESLRSDSHYVSVSESVPSLLGKQAYFGIAPALTQAFPGERRRVPRSLFVECVKAVIQSECYLYRQRGFSGTAEYQAFWDRSHPGSCRYYSHLDRVSRRWFGYIGEEARTGHLFHRNKCVSVWQSASATLQGSGMFQDSFHELGAQAECASDGTIRFLQGNFLRAPDPVCFGTQLLLQSLLPCKLLDLDRKKLQTGLGGPEGCAHLLDLCQDLLLEMQPIFKRFDSDNR